MSKLNIFKKEWLDIVFEGRNKSYGAYQLRSENPKVTTFALFAGIALFGVGLASPLIIKAIEGSLGNNKKDAPLDTEITLVDLPPPPPIELPPPPPVDIPPPPPEATKSVVDTKKFTPPKVVEKEKVVEEIAKVEEFKDKDPGTKDAKGDKDKGEIKTGGATGTADKGTTTEGEEDGNKIFIAVQVTASPPGGMAGFTKTFISRFRTPDIDSSVKKIQVIVKFIVEKDGSLTDITVLRDPGYGAGKEAVRVLQNMPKWKPAVQNGKNVRSQFTLPITIQVQ